eukprot:gene29-32_t
MPAAITKEIFGSIHDSTPIHRFTITNKNGLSFQCTNYGATILSIRTPDRRGTLEEITLNYDTLEMLQKKEGRPYYGCIVGRYANRIGKGRFSLDENVVELAVNNGPNHLHGGLEGFDQKIWTAVEVHKDEGLGIEFSYCSPDGEEGYPGNLMVSVCYLLTDEDDLVMTYSAFTDKATVVNITNHAYWNLSGNLKDKIYDHHLQLASEAYLPSDNNLLPIGTACPVHGTPFDFTSERRLIEVMLDIDGGGRPGLDHCFIITDSTESDEAERREEQGHNDDGVDESEETTRIKLHYAAKLYDPTSGRELILRTTQPGVQVYTANWLSLSPTDAPHCQHYAICLETQHFPDSPNRPEFPSTTLLPGEAYLQTSIFSFRVR